MGGVLLDCGEWVKGMLYPEEVAGSKPDISDYGDWRKYVESRRSLL